jgi:hypothetical protein
VEGSATGVERTPGATGGLSNDAFFDTAGQANSGTPYATDPAWPPGLTSGAESRGSGTAAFQTRPGNRAARTRADTARLGFLTTRH